jgi:aminopeptidase N
MEKVLSLNNGVTIYNEHQMQENRREIASIANVRTRRNDGGVIKSFSFEGQKYEIHIKNTKNFNEADDYLTMTSSDGHQMTYPITCQ